VHAQVFQRNEFQCAYVGRREHDSRRASGFKRFLPSSYAQTPAIAAFETGEVEFGNRCAEIVAGGGTETKELLAHHRAHCVQALIARASAAITIAIKARERLLTAGFEFTAQNVSKISHALILLQQSRLCGTLPDFLEFFPETLKPALEKSFVPGSGRSIGQ